MPRRPPTNLASLARGMLDWAEKQGIDRERLLRATALDRAALDGSRARISREAHVALWRETERALSDPNFALKAAPSLLRASSFGVVGLLAMTSATVGESIARAAKYGRVVREDAVTRSYVEGDLLVVEFRLDAPTPRAVTECSIAAFRVFMEQWTGERVRVREVFFQHPRPDDTRVYDELFDCPVHFDHATNAIVFNREVTEIPLVTAQSEVAAYLEDMARSSLDELERAGGASELVQHVTRAVQATLQDGDACIEKVAKRLGVSTRSLQRSLAAHSLSFRALVDDARWSLAGPLVTSTDLSIDEIAERLGYSESKAFRRAFRRWAGVSPMELRRASRARAVALGVRAATKKTSR